MLSALGLLAFFFWVNPRPTKPKLSKREIAQSLTGAITQNRFPSEGQVVFNQTAMTGQFNYTLNAELQSYMEKLLGQYKPDYGAFVAVDPKTGAILSLLSYTREKKDTGNLALKASFPAASIFKIVTAAAAFDKNKANPETVVSFTGANHTLYRQNLKPPRSTRWVRRMRLREAFARSVNTVFGKLGIYTVPKEDLNHYAEKFQFNQVIPADLPVESGTFEFAGEDPLSVAEIASGFNRNVLMSPLQGAMIGGAIANNGAMMEPFLVQSFKPENPGFVYQAEPRIIANVVSPETARELRTMMQDTVRVGTSRKSFRGLVKKSVSAEIEMGGKTGSLTGNHPKGKYDWFVGYAKQGDRAIAMAALTINEENWRVKSSYLARSAVEQYFEPEIKLAKIKRKKK
ncbi:MAG: penicillin-binding protein [Proteobacteria bacterium]|nr:penicillin-binding protein [Pseudomonadota bacterium]